MMSEPDLPAGAEALEEGEEETVEINVDVTEEGEVCLHGTDFQFYLSPSQARELGALLVDAAEDAEGPTE